MGNGPLPISSMEEVHVLADHDGRLHGNISGQREPTSRTIPAAGVASCRTVLNCRLRSSVVAVAVPHSLHGPGNPDAGPLERAAWTPL
nr:hypothetical protein [Synechococcus sp. PROS-9-1]